MIPNLTCEYFSDVLGKNPPTSDPFWWEDCGYLKMDVKLWPRWRGRELSVLTESLWGLRMVNFQCSPIHFFWEIKRFHGLNVEFLKRRMQSACKWLMWNRTNKWSSGPLLQELFFGVSLCRFRLSLQIFQRVHSLEQLLGKLDLDAVKEARGLMEGGWVVGHWPVWFQLPTTVWGPPLCCKWDNGLMPLKLA